MKKTTPTGRLASQGPSQQHIVPRTEEFRQIRDAALALDEWLWVDYSDIEQRLNAGPDFGQRYGGSMRDFLVQSTARAETPSPTKPGNVCCMDCRCGGHGCPGMPPGYEQRLTEGEW